MIFNKNGGRIPDGGGVAYQFTQKGVIRLDVPAAKTDAFEEAVIESGADDYVLADGFGIIYVSPQTLHTVKDAIEASGFPVESAKVERVANTPIEIDETELEKVAKLLDLLDENDDVTNVYTNLAE